MSFFLNKCEKYGKSEGELFEGAFYNPSQNILRLAYKSIELAGL